MERRPAVMEIEERGVAIAEAEGMAELEGLLDLDGSVRRVRSVLAAMRAEIARLGQTEGIHLDFEESGNIGGEELGETQIDD